MISRTFEVARDPKGISKLLVHSEYFTSMGEAVRVIKAKPIKNDHLNDQYLQTGWRPSDPKWSGFETVDELLDFCQNGLKDMGNVTKVMKYANKAMVQEKDKLTQKCMSVAGGAVDVPLFLSGSPECMMGLKHKKVRSRIIKAAVNCEVLCDIGPDEYVQAGSAIAKTVASLEKAGYRVRLVANCALWNTSKDAAQISVVIKRENEPCNFRRLLYPMMSPSFFRGLGFNWFTTLEGYNPGWGLGQRMDQAFYRDYKDQAMDYMVKKVCGEGFERFSIDDVVSLIRRNDSGTVERFLRAKMLDLN